MNKAPLALGLVGLLGYNTATADLIFAQNEIIKFGKRSELTYEASPRPYDEQRHERTMEQRIGQSWGQFYITKTGNFIIWGVLDGVSFVYSPGILSDSLSLARNDVAIEFTNQPNDQEISKDYAMIDGVKVQLDSSNSYEVKPSSDPWEKMDLKQRIHRAFSTYLKWLNIEPIKAKAQKAKESIKPDQLQKILDIFKPE